MYWKKSKRARACEFNSEERSAIFERDRGRCIICGSASPLTFAHYIPRSAGGLGIRQNGALICLKCHHEIDNGAHTNLRKSYKAFFKSYLNLHYPDFSDEERKYKKNGINPRIKSKSE